MAIEKLLREALALSREDRARLANALQDSLGPDSEDQVTEAEWEAAWTDEIERRLHDVDEGRATAINHDEFKNRVRARLQRQ